MESLENNIASFVEDKTRRLNCVAVHHPPQEIKNTVHALPKCINIAIEMSFNEGVV